MRKNAIFCCLMLLIPAIGHRAFAQDAPKAAEPPHYYHLDFVVQELGEDGKPVNSRSYSTAVNTDRTDNSFNQIRTGSKIPVLSGAENKDMQYMDVGVNIDTRAAREIGHQLALNLTADVSSLAAMEGGLPAHPVIHQNRWSANALIPIGKSTVVFSSENLENKGKMQLMVTATPLQ
jgi:hypothetical protein